MSVEFAVVLPAVVMVTVIVVGAVLAAGTSVRLQVAAAAVARALGRDDTAAADAAAAALAPGARITVRRDSGIVCVDASSTVRIGVLPGTTLRGTGCSIASGR